MCEPAQNGISFSARLKKLKINQFVDCSAINQPQKVDRLSKPVHQITIKSVCFAGELHFHLPDSMPDLMVTFGKISPF